MHALSVDYLPQALQQSTNVIRYMTSLSQMQCNVQPPCKFSALTGKVPSCSITILGCIAAYALCSLAEPSKGFGILEWSGKLVSQGTLVKGVSLY